MADKKKIVILGGGIGGLSAGYFLARSGKFQVTLLEKTNTIGGVCGSFKHDGFILDYGAHKLYSVIPGILDEIKNVMEGRLLRVLKKNRIFLRGHLLDYPLKLGNLAKVLGAGTFLKLGLGYAVTFINGLFDKSPASSYAEYIMKKFGRGTYELVFEPLADKVWGDPSTLHPDMARTRIPASGGIDVILRLLGIKKESKDTSAEYFFYPEKGFGDFPLTLKEKIEQNGGRVFINAGSMHVKREAGRITGIDAVIDGQAHSFECDYMVSSIPLSSLGGLTLSHDKKFIGAVQKLEFRSVVLVYVFVKRPLVLEDQWIFFPEREFMFSRIFEQKQMNPDLGPADRTAICCDFTCTADSRQWKAGDEEIAAKCIEGLIKGGFIKGSDVSGHLVVRFPDFYPRYDLGYQEKIKEVYNGLRQFDNLLLTGRIGMYNYNNADHCFDMGRFITEQLVEGKAINKIMDELESRVADYRIVD
ncbi:MAG: NAD(P)-binding protein [Nitrospirae bacterium]|nr:NAD(P)-binding protein [Nitrospirota bacterium]MBI4847275.1 NAD(P)-binding protein [Nitrospirota bacterium]